MGREGHRELHLFKHRDGTFTVLAWGFERGRTVWMRSASIEREMIKPYSQKALSEFAMERAKLDKKGP